MKKNLVSKKKYLFFFKKLFLRNKIYSEKAKFPAPKRRTSRPKKVKKAKSIVEAEKSELLTVSNNSETTKLKKVRKSKKDRDSKKAKKTKTPKKEKKQIIEDESKYLIFVKNGHFPWKIESIADSGLFSEIQVGYDHHILNEF